MSAGKVMLGPDGNPLLSADGKIVLADDLYPISLAHTYDPFFRRVDYVYPGCAITEQWNVDFGASMSNELQAYYIVNSEQSTGVNCAARYNISENTIDWARVAKVEVFGTLFATAWIAWPEGLTCKITQSKNNNPIPNGSTVKDSWDTAATFTAAGVYPVKVSWDVNGVEPTSLEIALMFDADTCALESDLYVQYNPSGVGVRIVYNLATA